MLARSPALAGALLAVLAMAVGTTHAVAPAASPEAASGATTYPSSSPWSLPPKAPAGTLEDAMEMETLLLSPTKALAAAGAMAPTPDSASQEEDEATVAPDSSLVSISLPPEAAAEFAMGPFAASPWGDAPSMVPEALGPVSMISAPPEESPADAPGEAPVGEQDEAPAGTPDEPAEAAKPSAEIMAAPTSGDYDVLNEEALAPAGEAGSSAEESGSKKKPAEAPGPSSEDEEEEGSGACNTGSSLAVAVIVAALSALAAF